MSNEGEKLVRKSFEQKPESKLKRAKRLANKAAQVFDGKYKWKGKGETMSAFIEEVPLFFEEELGHRSAGGKITAEQRRAEAAPLHELIRAYAAERAKSGKDPRNTASLAARRFGISPDHARKIIKQEKE